MVLLSLQQSILLAVAVRDDNRYVTVRDTKLLKYGYYDDDERRGKAKRLGSDHVWNILNALSVSRTVALK